MSMTDPVADLLTRIRNGLASRKAAVELPASKLKLEVAKILKEEGYITNFKVTEEGPQGVLRVELRYGSDGRPAITGIQRVSRPGLRAYVGADRIKPVLGGLGIAILSTSRGLMTDVGARKDRVGGEVLCKVW